ncbi:MAG TPA: hypothetical protein VK609_17010 [Mucilaginibacter sp.]|nr:hypothetical protein [Mucilaginibacter sp.]
MLIVINTCFTPKFITGLQAGITNCSVNYSKLVFSDQIDSQFGYMPGTPTSAEPPLFDNRFYFDAGLGINLTVSNFNIGGAFPLSYFI